MQPETRTALVTRLARYDRLIEVGIGRRSDLARALAARDATVVATDVHERPTPEGVAFVRDDVTDPDPAVYADADAVYALDLPPELHRPARDVAFDAGADFLFTTLGTDQPSVPVSRETLPGETLYRARDGPDARARAGGSHDAEDEPESGSRSDRA